LATIDEFSINFLMTGVPLAYSSQAYRLAVAWLSVVAAIGRGVGRGKGRTD
jgi:hypothetical protein